MSATPRVIPIQPAGDPRQPPPLFEPRRKVYARAVSGWFNRWRWVMVWATQLVFYGLPWLSWNGRQAVLFDLDARRFYLPGLVLYPQDFIYLSALLVLSAFALFFFTAVAGRMWCGFACPQTVYTEIFMGIERRIEGDRIARMRLDQAPWSARKLARKGAKQAAWIALSLWTGFTFVGYFTPIRELAASATAFGLGPWESFWVFFYGLATYGNAGFLREQVCRTMCPYARFQGSMMDKDSLIIGYDSRRGESRGSRPRRADPKALGLGDCIDCTLCVQVCPTGIDIRNGLQMECIGCAACIDACDGVMDKMGYERGLIRYATLNGLSEGLGKAQMWRRVLRPRVLVYGALLAAVGVAFVTSLALRDPLRVNVVRDRGVMARLVEDGAVENVYRVLVMNATEAPQRYRIAVSGLPGLAVAGDTALELAPAAERSIPVSVRLPAEAAASLNDRTQHIRFEVTQLADTGEAPTVQEASTFILPR
ncbi:cytochrome c oxidase accessory protein CcoG [Azohydromonas caseinilytica]|uniref:Cytochrome c oxidase accessory protein CcoG n=1 Tax=Azohydromonas caseinilytica TaxID=2728836 RepID=A0A848FKR3_9BURK|nr:cytochrome c oxidase accessory protein CcoG [Azohydromonas caseinilytica]NML18929.1 cytochrome c oxidase accessory protein CcoG [Azohydromonas caseinilytica]